MKKNALRVIALVLVAGMLFAFASCTQEIHVRFVDKDGNDIDISGLVSTGGQQTVTPAPQENTTAAPAPQENTTAAPAPQENTTAAPAPQENTTAAPAPQEQTTAAPAPGNKMPATTQEITDFYKKAVDNLKAGNGGYTKKEWQNVDVVNISGIGMVDNAIVGVLGNFMTVEADAEEQINAKGSDEAKNRIAAWTLTDLTKVASAKCEPDGSNYKITIVMQDEDTPKKQGSVLGQVTSSLLYWEDIEETLTSDPTVTKILTGFSGIHVWYRHYTITAVMTPDGKFISIDHTADVDIVIGEAKVIGIPLRDKNGHMFNYCKFYDFKY